MDKKIGIKGLDIQGLTTKDVVFKISFDDTTTFPKYLALESADGDFVLKTISGGGDSSAEVAEMKKTIKAMQDTINQLNIKVDSMTSAPQAQPIAETKQKSK